jgi:glycosyltransferase involved in cell wall biosynthesis
MPETDAAITRTGGGLLGHNENHYAGQKAAGRKTAMRARRKLVMMFAGGGLTHASGGVGTFIRYLTDEWMTKPGTPEVRVVDTRGPGGKASMPLHFLKAIGLLLSWGCIGRIDLLHIHLAAYGSALRKGVLILIGDMLGIPVVVHMHGSNFYKFYADLPGPCQKGLRFILNRARYIVVLGDNWRQFLISSMGVDPDKIAIIANGVPGPGDLDRSQAAHGATCRIVFLGQIGERKGVPDLLAAFQTPRLLAKSWTATVAGDGEVDEFRAAIAKAGLQERVSVPGWVDREAASDLLREADIFVLPSHFEAMPIAILEAMAHGVAVIATPVGAIPEFLTDGQTALLVPPGAPDKLADAIVRLIDDGDQRRRLGSAGNQVFAERFDISVAAARILALYGSAVRPAQIVKSAGGGPGRIAAAE